MGEAVERATRRDLRRAMGTAAINVVNSHETQLLETSQRITELDRTCRQSALRVDRALAEHRAMLDAHAGILLRPALWQRLRWLVTGR